MLAAGLFFMGQFILFTYLRPFLEQTTQVDVSTLSLILLTMGGSGFIGSSLITSLLQRGLYRSLAAIPLLMALIAVVLVAVGGAMLPVAALLAAWGLLATAAPVAWWSWLARTLPHDAEAGGGLFVAVVQLAIAAGSTTGGLLFDWHGHYSTFAASAGVLVAACVMVLWTSRAEPRT
jgi:predicted MFS family arabinose efflux permease